VLRALGAAVAVAIDRLAVPIDRLAVPIDRLAVPIDRLATTSLQRLRSHTGPLAWWRPADPSVVHAPPPPIRRPSVRQGWRDLTRRRSARMLSAYVLIETEVGKVAHVAQALGDLDGVEVAEDLAGPYDVIARVQAPGLDQLGRLVVSRIQVVDGVTRTLTCMVIRR
jgi:DNA-binding Lrp family transcriptional regulator